MNIKQDIFDLMAENELQLHWIKCALVEVGYNPSRKIILRVNYTQEEIMNFFEKDLNIDYYGETGWDSIDMKGKIWFKDGTWIESRSDDSSDWWEYQKTPRIPDECYSTAHAITKLKTTINEIIRTNGCEGNIHVNEDGNYDYVLYGHTNILGNK